jgi:ribosomal protein L40E
MSTEIYVVIVIFVAGIIAVSALVVMTASIPSEAADLNCIRRNAAERSWEILFLEKTYSGRYDPARYQLRYRDHDGTVHEAVLERDGTSPIAIRHSTKLPKNVELAMTDLSMEMDCRKCGATIPKFSDRCPYCSSARNYFRMPNQSTEPAPGAVH